MDTWEDISIVSTAEFMGWEGLVSLRPGLVEDADSVADQVVWEELGTGAVTLVSLMMSLFSSVFVNLFFMPMRGVDDFSIENMVSDLVPE